MAPDMNLNGSLSKPPLLPLATENMKNKGLMGGKNAGVQYSAGDWHISFCKAA